MPASWKGSEGSKHRLYAAGCLHSRAGTADLLTMAAFRLLIVGTILLPAVVVLLHKLWRCLTAEDPRFAGDKIIYRS